MWRAMWQERAAGNPLLRPIWLNVKQLASPNTTSIGRGRPIAVVSRFVIAVTLLVFLPVVTCRTAYHIITVPSMSFDRVAQGLSSLQICKHAGSEMMLMATTATSSFIFLVVCVVVTTLVTVIVSSCYDDKPADESFQQHRMPNSRMLHLQGGGHAHIIRWSTAEEEEQLEVSIVCLHGSFDSAHSFANWAERLCSAAKKENVGVEVIAVDLPGHGLTGPWSPSQPVGAKDDEVAHERAADVCFVTDVLASAGFTGCKRPVVLVGHSLGGAVSIAYGAKFPDKVAGMVLAAPWGLEYRTARPFEWASCSPIVSAALCPYLWPVTQVLLRIAQRLTPRVLVRWLAPSAFGCEAQGDSCIGHIEICQIADRMHAMMLREGNRAALAERVQELVNEERNHTLWRDVVRQQLGALKCPVQLQWGEADSWLPASRASSFSEALSTAGTFPDVRMWPQLGHCTPEQAPQQSAEAAWEHIRHHVLRKHEAVGI